MKATAQVAIVTALCVIFAALFYAWGRMDERRMHGVCLQRTEAIEV